MFLPLNPRGVRPPSDSPTTPRLRLCRLHLQRRRVYASIQRGGNAPGYDRMRTFHVRGDMAYAGWSVPPGGVFARPTSVPCSRPSSMGLNDSPRTLETLSGRRVKIPV
eukprot:gene16740-biopygen11887